MASNDRCPPAGNYYQLILVGLLSLLITPAQADWVAGVTSDVDTHGVGGVVEYHWRDFATVGGLSGNIAVAGRIDGDGDAFAGAGVAGRYRFDGGFFIEGSFMPGLYRDGDTDLGGALQFRSLLGAGYEINDDFSISLSYDHMSNGSTQSDNPGSDAVMLRFIIR